MVVAASVVTLLPLLTLNALLVTLLSPLAEAISVSPVLASVIFRLVKAALPLASVVMLVLPVNPLLFKASEIITPLCATFVPVLSASCTTTLVMPAPTTVLAGCAVKISWLAVVAPRMEKLFIKIAMNNATARLGAVFAGFILFF